MSNEHFNKYCERINPTWAEFFWKTKHFSPDTLEPDKNELNVISVKKQISQLSDAEDEEMSEKAFDNIAKNVSPRREEES